MRKLYILFIFMSSYCWAQNINFTIDTAIDNGVSITETLVVGPDTYVLTVFHSGNEELDNLGGGDLIFFHSAIDPLTPYSLTITKNGSPVNFNLNSIDYDTLEAGSISLANQDDNIISDSTFYPLGAGTLTITNPANALDISEVKIIPNDVDDLNDFGFHNINVDVGTLSTSEIENEEFFSYYPNPVKDQLNITAIHTMSQIRVFNMLGQIVKTENLNTTLSNLDMSQLPYGAYFVEVTMANTIKTVRVIKQ